MVLETGRYHHFGGGYMIICTELSFLGVAGAGVLLKVENLDRHSLANGPL